MGIRMAETANCENCGALIYADESFRGRGFRCGCLVTYIRELEAEVEKLRTPTLWDIPEVEP